MKYDFECSICERVVEVSASIKTGPIPPACHHIPMQRIYTPTNFCVYGYTSKNGFDKNSNGWKRKVSVNPK